MYFSSFSPFVTSQPTIFLSSYHHYFPIFLSPLFSCLLITTIFLSSYHHYFLILSPLVSYFLITTIFLSSYHHYSLSSYHHYFLILSPLFSYPLTQYSQPFLLATLCIFLFSSSNHKPRIRPATCSYLGPISQSFLASS